MYLLEPCIVIPIKTPILTDRLGTFEDLFGSRHRRIFISQPVSCHWITFLVFSEIIASSLSRPFRSTKTNTPRMTTDLI